MNYDLLFAILFYSAILLYFFLNRKKFDVQGLLILYRTKIGLKAMDKIAKRFPKILKVFSYLSITLGFLGMGLMFFYIIKGAYSLLISPQSQPILAPVLPGVQVAGLPVLSFWHWVISILVVVIVHEFAHGIYARLSNVKVKHSGLVLFGPILGAFVEPDEKQVAKQKKYNQLSILSAGTFSNMLFGFIFLAIAVLIISPIASSTLEIKGVQIVSLNESFSISQTGIQSGEALLSVNNIEIKNSAQISEALKDLKPGDKIPIKTTNFTTNIILGSNPTDNSKAMLGIQARDLTAIKEGYGKWPGVLFWLLKLSFWLFTINLGVGLFNLLPLGFLDGGRMFYLAALAITKKESRAKKALKIVSVICLFLILFNLYPYIIKFLQFIFTPFRI